jgi:hypothetical protein
MSMPLPASAISVNRNMRGRELPLQAGPTQITPTTAWQRFHTTGTLDAGQTGLWIVVRQFDGNGGAGRSSRGARACSTATIQRRPARPPSGIRHSSSSRESSHSPTPKSRASGPRSKPGTPMPPAPIAIGSNPCWMLCARSLDSSAPKRVRGFDTTQSPTTEE